MKKLVWAFLFVFMVISGVTFSACGEDNSKMTISVDTPNVEIIIGETEDDSKVIRVKVENATDYSVSFSYDRTLLSITQKEPVNGVTEATIKAIRKCNTEVTVKGVAKSTTFSVKAYPPVQDIIYKGQQLSIAYSKLVGGSFVLSNDLFDILPKETEQTQITYNLLTEFAGVSLQDNKVMIDSGLDVVPTQISLEAVSAIAGKENVKSETFSITVIPEINQAYAEVLDESGNKLTSSVSISRNGEVNNKASVFLRVANQEEGLEINVTPKFRFNDKGLICNDIIKTKFTTYTEFEFVITYASVANISAGIDYLTFDLYYVNYPSIKITSNPVEIETYDVLTSISYEANNTLIEGEKEFDIYTSYAKGVLGLNFEFTAIPTTVENKNIIISIPVNAIDYLDFYVNNVQTNVSTANGELKVSSGDVVSVRATDIGYGENNKINVVVSGEENPNIRRTFTLVLNQGLTKMNFMEDEQIVTSPTFYLENKANGSQETNKKTIRLYVEPANVELEKYVSLSSSNGVIEIDQASFARGENFGNGVVYTFDITAVNNTVGEGVLTVSTESGFSVDAYVNVFERFDENKVNVKIDTSENSSVIGDIKYENSNLRSIAIHNGHSVGLIYDTKANITNISYMFYEKVLNSDAYDPDYVDFIRGNKDEYSISTNVISTPHMINLQRISGMDEGKVWVKVILEGKCLEEVEGNLGSFIYTTKLVEKDFLVEVYNPITSISVSTRVIELYPHDEIGQGSVDLYTKSFVVTLNNGETTPTYYRLDWSRFYNSGEDTDLAEIDSLGSGVYKITMHSRPNKADGSKSEGPLSVIISAKNFNQEFSAIINVKFKIPQSVEKINLLNVQKESGIYIDATSSKKSFKILTSVLPDNALIKDLTYMFLPNYGTNQDILTIDNTGLINVVSEIGGTGVIRIIPSDHIIIENGVVTYLDGVEDVMVDVPIVVADGTSRLTSIQIDSLNKIKNNNLHYTITKDVEFNGTEPLFDEFNGGLYGTLIGSNLTYSIKMNCSSALFTTLSQTATVSFINFYGEVQANAMIALTNNGLISDVKVDVYSVLNQDQSESYTISKITGDGVVGGLVSVNQGLIKNSSFVGNVTGTTVGGIAGENSGTISNSYVHFVKYEDGKTSSITGTTVGGIAGVVSGSGVIENAYAYNYSGINSALNGTTEGIIAGQINGSSALLRRVFGSVDNLTSLVGKVADENGENESDLDAYHSTIKDSYYIYAEQQTVDGNTVLVHKFVANMTAKNGTLSTFTATQGQSCSYNNIIFSSSNTWMIDSNFNFGFPYLNAITNPSELQLSTFSDIKIQNTKLSIAQFENNAVLFVNRTNEGLTSAEQIALTKLNTISYKDLLNIGSSDIVLVSSSNASIVSTTANSVSTKSSGKITLSIKSKFDLTASVAQITIFVVDSISDFKLSMGSFELSSGSNLLIKNGQSQTVTSSVKESVILTDRELKLNTPELNVGFYTKNGDKYTEIESGIVGSKLGTHIIQSTDETYYYNLEFEKSCLSGYGITETADQNIVNDIVKEWSRKNINVAQTKGADSVDTINVNNATISPSDVLTFKAYVISDFNYVISDFNEDNESLLINVYKTDDGLLEDANDLFETEVNWEKSESYGEKYKIYFNVKVEVKDEYKSSSFNANGYKIRLSSSSSSNIYKDVELKVKEQEIYRIDFSHYSMIGSSANGFVFNSAPSNVLSPGRTGMIQISLYPNYANYDYITVTAKSVKGQTLALSSLTYHDNAYKNANSTTYSYIENGIKIYKNTASTSSIAMFNVSVVVPSTVELDSVFDVVISAYSENSEQPLKSDVFSLIVTPPEKPGISVNGQSAIYAYVGQKVTATVLVNLEQSLVGSKPEVVETNSDITFENGYTGGDFYGSNYKKYSVDITIGDSIGKFTIKVETVQEINGIEETQYSYLTIYVVNFMLDFENTHLANVDGSDTLIATKLGYADLQFDIKALYKEGSNASEGAFKEFIEYGCYSASVNNETFYQVNYPNERTNSTDSLKLATFYSNIYFVNGNTSSPIYNSQKGEFNSTQYVSFECVQTESGFKLKVIGNALGTQQMKLVIPVKMPDAQIINYTYNFSIYVAATANEETPEPIYNAEQFIAMNQAEIASNFILMNDIVLYDYMPLANTTKIESLDGNGYTITIMTFDDSIAQNSTQNYALFESVDDSTTLKNLNVNTYHMEEIIPDASVCLVLNVAPIAITNNGTITNCHVVSYRSEINTVVPTISGLSVTLPSASDIETSISGFVITNSGSITNSRVGGTNIVVRGKDSSSFGDATSTPISLQPYVISAKGEISGFVQENKGLISSCYANNIRLINNSDVDYTTITSGFVKKNSGNILMSYAKGVMKNDTDIHALRYGIETSGIASGFVYENIGSITDSYSNLMLTNLNQNPGRNSAGFVYINQAGAVIKNTYSFSKIVNSSTTQMNFVGVNDYGDYQNYGEITSSYYYDEDLVNGNTTSVEDKYSKSAKVVEQVNNKDLFYGLSFVQNQQTNGVWKITTRGPELISANTVSYSYRYINELEDGSKIYAYCSGYEYGSETNPIIIRNATEFNEVFGSSSRTSVKQYYKTSTNEVFGSYRLVSDIDLTDLIAGDEEYRLNSSKMTLTGKYAGIGNASGVGKLDGNGLTISGLSISNTITESSENFGLFAKIDKGAMVINVKIEVGSTNKDDVITGISAKNTTYVGTLAGTVENASVINVKVYSKYPKTNSVSILGRNIVGGLAGRVVGESYVSNIEVTDISVIASYAANINFTLGVADNFNNLNKYHRQESQSASAVNSAVSYAGGAIGLFDYYAVNDIDKEIYSNPRVANEPNISVVKVNGSMKVAGTTVGGVLGYMGPLSKGQDLLFELSATAEQENDIINGTLTNNSAYQENQNTQQRLMSYNGFAGAVVGFNRGFLRQVRAEHESILQDVIEENVQNYYDGVNVYRGNLNLFDNPTYEPIAIGGIVGYQASGKIEKSYSKVNVMSQSAYIAGGIIGFVGNPQKQNGITEELTTLEEVYSFGNVRTNNKYGVMAGAIGYGSRKNDANVQIVAVKVNAVNYWADVDFDTFKNGTVGSGQYYTYIFGPNIKLNEGSKISTAIGYFTKEDIPTISLDSIGEDKFGKNIDNYKNFQGVAVDGEKMDIIFDGQDWDYQDWERDSDELLPHIKFGYIAKVYFIRTENDINLMRIHGNDAGATFVIIGNDTDKGMVKITKNIPSIAEFSATLVGYDNSLNYGFKIETNLTQPLFSSAVGAAFKDFTISAKIDNGEVLTMNMAASSSGILCGTAKESTEFFNIKLQNLHIISGHGLDTEVGILAGSVYGGVTASSIIIDRCSIEFEKHNDDAHANVGLLFGSAIGYSTDKARISNCFVGSNVSDGDENTESSIVVDKLSSNVGGLVGNAKNVNFSYNLSSENDDEATTGSQGTGNSENFKPAKVSITVNSKPTSNVNAGLVAGNAMYVSYNGVKKENSNYSSLLGSITINGNQNSSSQTDSSNVPSEIVEINVGGLFGRLVNDNKETIVNGTSSCDVVIDGYSTGAKAQYNVGGLVGHAETAILENCSALKATISAKDLNNEYNVGSFIGCALGATITDCSGSNDIITELNEYVSEFNAGGLVGSTDVATKGSTNENSNQKSLTISSDGYTLYDGNIITYGTAGESAQLRIAGGVAELNQSGSTLSKVVFGGKIKFAYKEIIKNTDKSDEEVIHSIDSIPNLSVGGIVAWLSNGLDVVENVKISSCYAYGDTYLNEFIGKDNNDEPLTLYGVKSVKNLNFGGIVGYFKAIEVSATDGQTQTTAEDDQNSTQASVGTNYSLHTFYNYKDEFVKNGDYFAGGAIGQVDKDAKVINDYAYSHVYTLVTGTNNNITYGRNESLRSMLGKFSGFVPKDEGKAVVGCKINPISCNNTLKVGDFKGNQYYYLEEGIYTIDNNAQTNEMTGIKLTNTVVVSDGATIVNENKVSAIFASIDQNSYVAGIQTKTANSVENGSISGFVNENKGIIYSCNSKGLLDDDVDLKGTGKSTVAGFVLNNLGLIKDCFSHIDVAEDEGSSTSSESESKYSVFSVTNTGIILNSYSSGSLEVNNSSSHGYLFGGVNPSENSLLGISIIKNCYTIASSQKGDNILLKDYGVNIYAFFINVSVDKAEINSNAIIDCYYDMFATELPVKTYQKTKYNGKIGTYEYSTEELITDNMAVYYNKVSGKDSSLVAYAEGNKALQYSWGYNSSINYGYGSFSANGYKNVSYMQEITVDYESDNKTIKNYHIPNFGKLKQIGNIGAGSLNYKQVKNINARFIGTYDSNEGDELVKTTWKTFISEFSGKLDGNSYTISYMDIKNGLIAKNEGTLCNLKFENCKLIYTNGTTNGLIAVSNIGAIDNCVVNGMKSASDGTVSTATIGYMVGENSGPISNCILIQSDDPEAREPEYNGTEKDDVNPSIIATGEFTIGGIVGRMMGGKIQSSRFAGNIYIRQGSNNTLIFGGIVGAVGIDESYDTSATITGCSIDSGYLIIGSAEQNAANKFGTVYAGGILGKTQSGSVTISECYAAADESNPVIIYAGNNLTTSMSYAGGIVALGNGSGTTVTNCYNMAQVNALARIERKLDYIGSSWSDSLVYGNLVQKSYAGGIANNSEVTYSANYGRANGGYDKNTVISFNDTYNVLWRKMLWAGIFTAEVYALGLTLATPFPFDDWVAFGIYLASQIEFEVEARQTQTIDMYYSLGADWNAFTKNSKPNYFGIVNPPPINGELYTTPVVTEVKDFWSAIAVIAQYLTRANEFIDQAGQDYYLMAGTINYNYNEDQIIDFEKIYDGSYKDAAGNCSHSWDGFTSEHFRIGKAEFVDNGSTVVGYYGIESDDVCYDATANDILSINSLSFDPIGMQVTMDENGNVNSSKPIETSPETPCYTDWAPLKKIELDLDSNASNGKETILYKLDDNIGSWSKAKLLYRATDELYITSIGDLKNWANKLPKDDTGNTKWTQFGDKYILSSSTALSKTEASVLATKFDKSTNTLKIENADDLKGFAAFVNDYETYSTGTSVLNEMNTSFENGKLKVVVMKDIDLTTTWTNTNSIGTQERPFKGVFKGVSDSIRINNFMVQGTNVDLGLFGYVEKGATIESLNINVGTFKFVSDSSGNEVNVAVLISNIANKTQQTQTTSELNNAPAESNEVTSDVLINKVNINDVYVYDVIVKNDQEVYTNENYNLGIMIANVESGFNVEIKDSKLKYNIVLESSKDKYSDDTGSVDKATSIGGYVASFKGSKLEVSGINETTANRIKTLNNSNVRYIGGVVGNANSGNIKVSNSVIDNVINIVTTNKTAYAGGIVGYSGSSISLDGVELFNVSSEGLTLDTCLNKQSTLYAGAVVGYGTEVSGKITISNDTHYKEIDNRVYIRAGVGVEGIALQAHAGIVAGNKNISLGNEIYCKAISAVREYSALEDEIKKSDGNIEVKGVYDIDSWTYSIPKTVGDDIVLNYSSSVIKYEYPIQKISGSSMVNGSEYNLYGYKKTYKFLYTYKGKINPESDVYKENGFNLNKGYQYVDYVYTVDVYYGYFDNDIEMQARYDVVNITSYSYYYDDSISNNEHPIFNLDTLKLKDDWQSKIWITTVDDDNKGTYAKVPTKDGGYDDSFVIMDRSKQLTLYENGDSKFYATNSAVKSNAFVSKCIEFKLSENKDTLTIIEKGNKVDEDDDLYGEYPTKDLRVWLEFKGVYGDVKPASYQGWYAGYKKVNNNVSFNTSSDETITSDELTSIYNQNNDSDIPSQFVFLLKYNKPEDVGDSRQLGVISVQTLEGQLMSVVDYIYDLDGNNTSENFLGYEGSYIGYITYSYEISSDKLIGKSSTEIAEEIMSLNTKVLRGENLFPIMLNENKENIIENQENYISTTTSLGDKTVEVKFTAEDSIVHYIVNGALVNDKTTIDKISFKKTKEKSCSYTVKDINDLGRGGDISEVSFDSSTLTETSEFLTNVDQSVNDFGMFKIATELKEDKTFNSSTVYFFKNTDQKFEPDDEDKWKTLSDFAVAFSSNSEFIVKRSGCEITYTLTDGLVKVTDFTGTSVTTLGNGVVKYYTFSDDNVHTLYLYFNGKVIEKKSELTAWTVDYDDSTKYITIKTGDSTSIYDTDGTVISSSEPIVVDLGSGYRAVYINTINGDNNKSSELILQKSSSTTDSDGTTTATWVNIKTITYAKLLIGSINELTLKDLILNLNVTGFSSDFDKLNDSKIIAIKVKFINEATPSYLRVSEDYDKALVEIDSANVEQKTINDYKYVTVQGEFMDYNSNKIIYRSEAIAYGNNNLYIVQTETQKTNNKWLMVFAECQFEITSATEPSLYDFTGTSDGSSSEDMIIDTGDKRVVGVTIYTKSKDETENEITIPTTTYYNLLSNVTSEDPSSSDYWITYIVIENKGGYVKIGSNSNGDVNAFITVGGYKIDNDLYLTITAEESDSVTNVYTWKDENGKDKTKTITIKVNPYTQKVTLEDDYSSVKAIDSISSYYDPNSGKSQFTVKFDSEQTVTYDVMTVEVS